MHAWYDIVTNPATSLSTSVLGEVTADNTEWNGFFVCVCAFFFVHVRCDGVHHHTILTMVYGAHHGAHHGVRQLRKLRVY